jgi:hypothetical protein
MRKYIIGAIAGALATVTLLAGGVALSAVTVVLTGPETYADSQWKAMCISNKNGDPNYRANIEVCPSTSVPGVPGACSTTELSVATLPASAQTLINYMINQWCTAHPGYCS